MIASLAIARARTLDRPLMLIAAILLGIGVLVSMAASPAASHQFHLDEAFYFALRHAGFAALGVVIAVGFAQADPRLVRRAGAVIFALMLPLCALVALIAPDVRGAARWIDIGLFTFQPSEVLKPALVIVWAWMLAETYREPRFPGWQIAAGLYALTAAALLAQPDIGQTALLGAVLFAMLALSGLRLRWLALTAASGAAAAATIVAIFPHARVRLAGFFDPNSPEAFQVRRALGAISSGGVFGRGPGEGVVKRGLPDAHADFVYAVASEEFGIIASFGLAALFAAFAFRGLSRASRLAQPFEQLAAAGLTTLIVLQGAIHIAVNVALAPAKGMTLPFVSYGGSSMIGAALALGFLLALTRQRPGAYIYEGAP